MGFWKAGNCAFTVTKWSSHANIAPMKLDFSPLWIILRNVPAQLFSFEGISTIASGLCHPLYTEHRKLTPNMFGLVKVKLVMKFDKKFLFVVRVRDKLGISVIILTKFPHVPQKCASCSEFGHLSLRCFKMIAHPQSDSKDPSSGKCCLLPVPNQVVSSLSSKSKGSVTNPSPGFISINSKVPEGSIRKTKSVVVRTVEPSHTNRAHNRPSSPMSETYRSSQAWTKVARRSKHISITSDSRHEDKRLPHLPHFHQHSSMKRRISFKRVRRSYVVEPSQTPLSVLLL